MCPNNYHCPFESMIAVKRTPETETPPLVTPTTPLRLCNTCKQHHSQQTPELRNKSPSSTSLSPPRSRQGNAGRATDCIEMADLSAARARMDFTARTENLINSSNNPSKNSVRSSWGQHYASSGGSDSGYSTSPETNATSRTVSSDKVSQVKNGTPEKFMPLFGKTAIMPDEYLLSVRVKNGIFFPTQVSSTLLWDRSGWFKKQMSKPSPSGPSPVSATGLSSFYSTDSARGKMITVPFTTSQILDLYTGLLLSDKIKIQPQLFIDGRHSAPSMSDLVDLYFLCVKLEDPISAKLTLEDITKGLPDFTDDETLDNLTASIWDMSAEGIKTEMQALRRQFRNWGLRSFAKWLPGVNQWMEEEGVAGEDLEGTGLFTRFQRDVVFDYWMDQA